MRSRWIPDSLFGRLALLLSLFVIASHVLALMLLLGVNGPPPLPGGGPPPGPPPSFTAGLVVDIVLRLGVLLAGSWVAARWLSGPIGRLSQAAQRLGWQSAVAALPETGPAECRDAARVFNQMQLRIQAQLDERHRFVAAVSHDLRTPLTRLRLRAENLTDPVQRDRFRSDVEEMDRMISATLDYLRGAAAAEPHQRVDLRALVDSIAEDQRASGHRVLVTEGGGATLAPASALRRCIVNLVDNAVRYGGEARIALSTVDSRVRIDVHDRGPGIPADELSRVFEPFHRVDRSRNQRHGGTGLGLSIARDIATACGGSIELCNERGGGLVARLDLPRCSEQPGHGSAADLPRAITPAH